MSGAHSPVGVKAANAGANDGSACERGEATRHVHHAAARKVNDASAKEEVPVGAECAGPARGTPAPCMAGAQWRQAQGSSCTRARQRAAEQGS